MRVSIVKTPQSNMAKEDSGCEKRGISSAVKQDHNYKDGKPLRKRMAGLLLGEEHENLSAYKCTRGARLTLTGWVVRDKNGASVRIHMASVMIQLAEGWLRNVPLHGIQRKQSCPP